MYIWSRYVLYSSRIGQWSVESEKERAYYIIYIGYERKKIKVRIENRP